MRLLFFLALCTATASAQEIPRRTGDPIDTWSEPNPGVRYLRRTIEHPRESIHAVIADLTAPGVRVIATPQDDRWSTVTEFARAHDAAVAVNGGFWSMWQRPTGVTAGGGALWNGSSPDPEFGHFGMRNGRGVIHGPGEGEDERTLSRLSDAVSGRPMLVVDSSIASESLDTFATANQRQPRTAVGIANGGRTVIFIVADGRQNHSRGLTLYELARTMVELGAERAINLDGGGSSAMYVERGGGLVSSPSRGRWAAALGMGEQTTRVRTVRGEEEVYVRGVEREVMNHLAILAPSPPVPIALPDDPLAIEPAAPEIATFAPAAQEPVRLGEARELLYPGLWLGIPAFALVMPVVVWRRRRRR